MHSESVPPGEVEMTLISTGRCSAQGNEVACSHAYAPTSGFPRRRGLRGRDHRMVAGCMWRMSQRALVSCRVCWVCACIQRAEAG